MNAITPNTDAWAKSNPEYGRVTLVGAGPGAADLITRRGATAIAEADVIIADGLVGPDLHELASASARWIDAAKRVGVPSITQDGIIDLMTTEAKAGHAVVRLKGGDVGLFARAGEEIAALKAQGIEVDIVPGVTAASASAAAAGISLTQRDLASAVTFMTGHTKEESLPDLDFVAGDQQTLVVYMGLGQARTLSKELAARGFSASTPVAVIERASHDDERVLNGTLRTLPDLIESQSVKSPALLIIGDVVRTGHHWWRSETPVSPAPSATQPHLAHG